MVKLPFARSWNNSDAHFYNPYPVFLQNINTKDVNICVVLGPCQVTCRYIPDLKVSWGKARLLSNTIMVILPFARSGNNPDANY